MRPNLSRNRYWTAIVAAIAAICAVLSSRKIALGDLQRTLGRHYWTKVLQMNGYRPVAGGASTIIEFAERITKLSLNGTVVQGNLLAHDGTGWVQADASAATYLYAQWIAMEGGVSGDEIQACKKCTLFDDDAPYTANAPYYASGTAGAITATRPATDGDLIQVVGRGVSTKRVALEVLDPKEYELFLQPFYHTALGGGAEYNGAADAGWGGPQVDASGEIVLFNGRLPSGIVGSIAAAKIVMNSIGASAFDNDVTVVRAYDGASNVQDTGTAITAGDWEQADTDNIILTQDVSACFDADFYKPNASFNVKMDPDGITNDVTVIGLYIRGWKV